MKVVRQARLELSGGSTPDLLRPGMSVSNKCGSPGNSQNNRAPRTYALASFLQPDTPQCVCLLDIANAFPNTPNAAILQALSCIGVPPQLLKLIEKVNRRHQKVCGGRIYQVYSGIKEGCPHTPTVFTLVYEYFHRTLQLEFLLAKFFVHVDEVACVTHTENGLLVVLNRVHEFSWGLGFCGNHSKIKIAP